MNKPSGETKYKINPINNGMRSINLKGNFFCLVVNSFLILIKALTTATLIKSNISPT
jgi:hypothetical protein